ncbi:MAG: fumarylacetoacetate hydrolase family protein [Actinomycetota bacterium]
MRLATFSTSDDPSARAGVVLERDHHLRFHPIDLPQDAGAAEQPMLTLMRLSPHDLMAAAEQASGMSGLSQDEVSLQVPLVPTSLRDFIGFEDHARAGANRRGEDLSPAWFERPFYYKGNHLAVVAPGHSVKRPSFTSALDFEMEVACIVGQDIIDANEEQAGNAIFGYTIMNDWSARDVQKAEMASRLGPSKSKDFATSLGPYLLTADDLSRTPSLQMTARVNDETVCTANLGELFWTFPRTISFVSQGEMVRRGDVFGSGTAFGGCMLDQGGRYLEPGDTIELEVEGIGVLRNTVA